MSAGVLNQEEVTRILLKSEPPKIKGMEVITVLPDPSSIDLPLGDTYWEMPASCRPREDYSVRDLIREYGGEKKTLSEETIFEKEKIYLVEIAWTLQLPENICARGTAKSSIGRLDALVRLVADGHNEFDRVEAGKTTNLYVEVAPITFSLKVRPGMALSQLRFIKGDESLCTIPASALKYEDTPVLVDNKGEGIVLHPAESDSNAVFLSLDLSPDPNLGFVGFVAKKNINLPIDPSIRKPNEETSEDNRYRPEDFWGPVIPEDGKKAVKIERDSFYIFRSKERFRVPAHLAVECVAYTESLGDIRIHYAGFAHPFFGFEQGEKEVNNGTPLIFEVRGHSLDTYFRDHDALAKVYFRRMSNAATPDEAQIYNKQELQLSGCFKEWGLEGMSKAG
jgi:dCTP deaminase